MGFFEYSGPVANIHEKLHNKTGAGSEFLGWLNLRHDSSELVRIHKVTEKIQRDSDVLLVIGIGGSYLGAQAAIEMLHHTFRDLLPEDERKTPHVFLLGSILVLLINVN